MHYYSFSFNYQDDPKEPHCPLRNHYRYMLSHYHLQARYHQMYIPCQVIFSLHPIPRNLNTQPFCGYILSMVSFYNKLRFQIAFNRVRQKKLIKVIHNLVGVLEETVLSLNDLNLNGNTYKIIGN